MNFHENSMVRLSSVFKRSDLFAVCARNMILVGLLEEKHVDEKLENSEVFEL